MKSGLKTSIRVILKIVLIVVGLAALIVIIAALAGVFTEKIPPGEKAISGRVLPDEDHSEDVHEIIKPYDEESVGTLKAAQRTEISSRILAPIQEITVRAGQTVQAGDVLVKLDPRATEGTGAPGPVERNRGRGGSD